MKTYPEHEKLKAFGGANQIVGDFIEWLHAQGWEICEEDALGYYEPIRESRDELIAKHFEINPRRLDKEKEEMLEEIRRVNSTPSSEADHG